MEKKPLISVVVPVYQVEQWLQRCVDSLLKQTYQNKEIILVDDGSLDRGGEICDEYAARERSIRVIHQLNQGLSAARNAGTLNSNGQYITFVDSDDWVEPDYLEKLWSVIYNTGADVAVCGYSKEPEGTVFGRIDGKTECFSPERAIELLCYQKCVETSAWAKLYRTEDAREFLYPEGRVFEDIATTYKFFANANRVAMYGGALYHYWQHPGSIMASRFQKSRFDALSGANELYEFVVHQYPKLERAANCRRFSCYCQVLLMMPKQGYEAERRHIWRILRASRKSVLLDRNARKKNRMAALLCFGGESVLRFVWTRRC